MQSALYSFSAVHRRLEGWPGNWVTGAPAWPVGRAKNFVHVNSQAETLTHISMCRAVVSYMDIIKGSQLKLQYGLIGSRNCLTSGFNQILSFFNPRFFHI